MKSLLLSLLFTMICLSVQAQPEMPDHIRSILPEGTVVHENIPYADDDLDQHLLDIYLPADADSEIPLVVFVHGGGWISNDKYADMGYMTKTMADMLNNGFAIASIDYRFAFDAVFPLILQDCNQAVSYLFDNADTYDLDFDNVALMGFSAGGHLATLMGTSQNNAISQFYTDDSYRPFEYKGVVDFYGPIDLMLFPGNDNPESPEAILIGATPLSRPDLAKAASPLTYIDENDPPFIIIHGEKDDIVSNKQSKLLSSWLDIYDVENELIIVEDAPHFGEMFDADHVRKEVIDFLITHLKP
tara:strand:+ start:46064 stop:46966 length:903 start_codon:yes stop_codon:yes gene_type:complete